MPETHPPSAKGRQRREAILDAAETILVEEGYSGFSSRRIAERLGIRLSNVQYYFPSRESLLAGVFERTLQAAADSLSASMQRGGLKPLTDFILADQQSPRSCHLFWELWALAARDADAAQVMTRYYERYAEALDQAIAQAAPHASPPQRRHRALLIMSLLEGASLFRHKHAQLGGTGAAFDAHLKEALQALARFDGAAD